MTPSERALSRRALLAALGITAGAAVVGLPDMALAAGEPVWGHPVQYRGVVSTIFNPGRSVDPTEREHFGIDFDNRYDGSRGGSRIFSVADGNITFSGWNGGHGYQVRVGHSGGWESGYSHMPSGSHLPVGTAVRRGDHIGIIGNTGNSFGPHLHLEIRSPSGLVDPAIRVMGAPLPGQPAPTTPPPVPAITEEDEMFVMQAPGRGTALVGPGYFRSLSPANGNEEVNAATQIASATYVVSDGRFDTLRDICTAGFGSVGEPTWPGAQIHYPHVQLQPAVIDDIVSRVTQALQSA